MTQRKAARLPRGMRQPSLIELATPLTFDAREGQRRAEVGMEAALYSTIGMPWADRAECWLAERQESFTSEHLVEAIGLPNGTVGTNRNNAVGAVLRKWSRQYRIVGTGYTRARRVESHGAMLTIWLPSWMAKAGAA